VAVGGAHLTAFLGVFGNTAKGLVAGSVPNLVMTYFANSFFHNCT